MDLFIKRLFILLSFVVFATTTHGQVAPIVGVSEVCVGATATFTNASLGGVWTVSNGNATISSGGVVTGVHAGVDTIFYMVSDTTTTNSIATKVITILPLPYAGVISGESNVCVTRPVTLSSSVSRGTWGIDGAGVFLASIDTLGRVRASMAGNITVLYMVSNSCGIDTASFNMHLFQTPIAGLVGSVSDICVDASATLFSTDTGGKWYSSDTSIVHVDSLSGLINARRIGTVFIRYSVTNYCGTASAFDTITVHNYPVLSHSLTPPAVCSGTPFSFSTSSSPAGAEVYWSRDTMAGIANAAVARASGDINETLISDNHITDTVIYTVHLSQFGCSNTQQVKVAIKPSPSLVLATTLWSCSGAEFKYILASDVAGTEFSWFRNTVVGVIPATGSGVNVVFETLQDTLGTPVVVTYQVHLNAAGCTADQSFNVTVEPPPPSPMHIVAITNTWNCNHSRYRNFGADSLPPADIDISWSANGADIWAQGSNKQYTLVNFNTPGYPIIYLNTHKAGAKCSSIDSFVAAVGDVESETPVVHFNQHSFITDSGLFSYQWGYEDKYTLKPTIIAGATSNRYEISNPDLTNKLYWVVTEHLWCKNKSYFNAPASVISVNAEATGLSIFPNPNSGAFNVQIEGKRGEAANIQVIDITGRVLLKRNCSVDETTEIDTGLGQGIYIAQVLIGGRVLRHYFQVQ